MATGRKADETTAEERSDKLGASGEAAGDLDAILADRVDDELEIRKRAHAIWEAEGRPLGRELDHWLRARLEHAKKG
jgi:hypothetical protein